MEILSIGLAYILGMVVSIIRLPPLVGYLGAGFLLSILGYSGGETLNEIGHLGVLFLLFTVGLHLRFKNLWRAEVIGVGALHLLISSFVFFMIALGFRYTFTSSVIIAVLLGFSSTVITAKSLESRGELGAYHGRVAIGILIMQDIIAISLLAITAGRTPSIWVFSLIALPLLRPILIKALQLSKVDELLLLYGLLLAIGGSIIFDFLGLSSELGALTAGALIAGHKETEDLSKKLWGLKEAFLVGFFLEVGLAGLPSMNELTFFVTVILLLPVKAILFFALFIAFKLRARTAFMSAISLSSYSEFILIAGVAAASTGFIPNSIVVLFALLVSASYALNAPIITRVEQIWERWEKKLLKFERDVKHPDQQVISLGGAQFLVVGMGSAGKAAYDYLKEKNLHAVGLDIDPGRIEANIQDGRRVVYGDAQDPELWKNVNMQPIKAVILTITNADPKILATKLLRKYGYSGEINTLTMKYDEFQLLQGAGANAVCLPIMQAGQKLAELSTDNNLDISHTSIRLEFDAQI
ncbi:cation:proton antiporter [Gracilimonas sp.]|uniref:cation:proton antiporter domain-containing protein n=1 Tax=Gracilimonas sp. TaxID=1974203 RepID=UPI0032EE9BF9